MINQILIVILYKVVAPRLFRQVLIPKDEKRIGRFMSLLEKFMGNCAFYLLECNQDKEKPERIWEEIRRGGR